MKKLTLVLLFMFPLSLFVLTGPTSAGEPSIRLVKWLPNTESDLAGYEIFYGRQSKLYEISIIFGKREEFPLVLETGIKYFFAMKAFDWSGNRSDFSLEHTFTVPVSIIKDIP